MKNVIEILEKQYQSFINQERDWNFFLGLADYLDFVFKEPVLNNTIKKIKESKEKERNKIEELDTKAVAELEAIKEKILNFFKNKKLLKVIAKELKELTNYKVDNTNDNTNIVFYENYGLDSKLKDTIKILWMNGYKDLVNEILLSSYNTMWKEPKIKEIPEEDIINCLYDLSPSSFSIQFKEYELNEKKNIELWGAYDKLYLLWLIVFHRHDDEYYNEYSKLFYSKLFKESESDKYEKFIELIREMWTIESNGAEYDAYRGKDIEMPNFSSSNDSRIKELKRDKYKLYATRIHNFLIQELAKTENEKENTKVNYKLSFDEERGVLSIGDKTVKFRKFTEQYHALRIIFADKDELAKEWFFSELGEKIDEEKHYTDKDFHNYFAAIKRRIASEASIKDLFITTTQSVKINSNYLKKI